MTRNNNITKEDTIMTAKRGLLALALLTTVSSYAYAEPVTLEFWTHDREGQYAFVMAQEFDAMNDDIVINVKRIPFAELVSDAIRAFAAGNAPDIINIDNPETALFASSGSLLDLSDMVAGSKVIKPDSIYPGPRASATWEGHLYAIPRASNTLALYYNADMFRAAGLDPDKPPRTWAELHEAAKVLNKPDQHVYGLAFSAVGSEEGTFQYLPFAQMAGADYNKLNTPGATKALEFWRTLLDEHLASPDTLIRGQWDSTGTFNAGNAAMVISGPWELPRMQEDAKFEWRVALLPVAEEGGPRASALGDFNNAIFSSTEHPKEAFRFLEYMYAQSHRVWNEFGFLSAVSDAVVTDPKWPSAYAVFAEQLKYARARGPHPQWPKISKAIQTAIQSTLTHQAEPEMALATAQKQVDRILKD
jgi:multiple sugar transport system substrate-binding protein